MLEVVFYCIVVPMCVSFPLLHEGVISKGFQRHTKGGTGSEGPIGCEGPLCHADAAPSDETGVEMFRQPTVLRHSLAVALPVWSPLR